MKLTQLRLSHFRRYVDASIDLDAPVVAIVGPNEAGKSTLLHAMTLLENDDPVEPSDLTDYVGLPPETELLTATYLLDRDERELAADAGSTEIPTWMTKSKRVDGKVVTRFNPPLARDLGVRKRTLRHVQDTLDNADMNELLAVEITVKERVNANKQRDATYSLRDFLDTTQTALSSDARNLSSDQMQALKGAIKHLEDVTAKYDQPPPAVLESLVEAHGFESSTPTQRLTREFEDMRPRFLLFGEAERDFRDEYSTSTINKKRPELANLLALGGSSIDKLREAMASADHGRRRGLETTVNEKLRQAVKDAWGQADVYPDLVIHDDHVRLHVNLTTERGSSKMSERSDGFKMFLAMLAFIRSRTSPVPPILMLDEAERHLHYDAQADLVAMFHSQDIAATIIYSTHSAGCLPHDLGAVRAVKPTGAAGIADDGRSTVVNGFWSEGPGFTPLLMLMGASTLAFSPMRRALIVVGEGASELVLLPAVFSDVAPGERLTFQVAPGLAEVDRDKVHELDGEAARTCYLVDGDKAGRQLAGRLRRQRVPDRNIVALPSMTTIEDMVRPDLLLIAVSEELRRSGHEVTLDASALGVTPRWDAVRNACKAAGVSEPSKVRVARRIVEAHAEELAEDSSIRLIDPSFQDIISDMRAQILAAFDSRTGG